MELALDVLSWIFIVAGGAFLLIGGIGMLRLPDVFARMHAAGIIDTAGAALVFIGLMIQGGLTLVTVKLIFIVVFILYTSPVSTHALAQSALSTGVKPHLAEGEEKQEIGGDEPSKT